MQKFAQVDSLQEQKGELNIQLIKLRPSRYYSLDNVSVVRDTLISSER